MGQVKAAFIMTIYNTPEDWLRPSVESILHQTCPDLVLLIRDNGSTDKTSEILREYAGKDSRIVLFRNQVNNVLTPEECTDWLKPLDQYLFRQEAEFYAVLDSDDCYAPDFLEIMYRAAAEKQAELAVCGTTMVDEAGQKTLRERLPPALALERREMSARQFTEVYGSLRSVWGKLFRTSLFESYNNGFSRAAALQVGNGADTISILTVMCAITRFVAVPKSLHTYRVRTSSVYQGTRGTLSPNRVREGEQLFLVACQTAKAYGCLDWETMQFLYQVYYFHIYDLLAALLENPSMTPESKVSYFRVVLDAPLFTQISETSSMMVQLMDQMLFRLLTPELPVPVEQCLSLLHQNDLTKQNASKRQLIDFLNRKEWEQARRVEASLVVQCPLDQELLYLRLYRMEACGEAWENACHIAQVARLLYPQNTDVEKLADLLERRRKGED